METEFLTQILDTLPDLFITLPWLGAVDITKLLFTSGLFLFLTAFFWVIRAVLLVRLTSLSATTTTDVDDMFIGAVGSIKAPVYVIVSLYIVLQLFALPPLLEKITTTVFLIALVWQAVEVALCFVEYGVRRFLEKDIDGDGVADPASATATEMVILMARIGLWIFGVIFVLSNLGIEVTSLIAGLGIGGIAVAFALQGILSDMFASFSLYFDKPFRIGDYIVIGTDSGTVEKIGIKTTRIRTLQGEELVVSNAELTTARVQNFKKMSERRVSFNFGITYETPHDKVQGVISMVEAIFTTVSGARLDRVHFISFGDSALLYEVVFYVESAEYIDYLNIQQAVNFALMNKFAEENIEFAYPTQTLYLKK